MPKRELTSHELEMLGRIAGVLVRIQKTTELLLEVARDLEGELVTIGIRLQGAYHGDKEGDTDGP